MSLNTYNNSSSYGMNGLNNSFSNMSFQQAGGPISIPIPPPLPQQSLYSGNTNSFLGNRNLYTRNWDLNALQGSQIIGQQQTSSYVFSSAPTVVSSASTVVSSAPAVVPANNMLPPPINDGRRYARLTGQKRGSNRSRRHLVQPLNQSGLTTLPAGVPVEGLGAAPLGAAPMAKGRRGRKAGKRSAQNNLQQNGLPATGYVSLGPLPSSGSSFPRPQQQQQLAQQQLLGQQQQQFVGLPQQQFVSAPLLATPSTGFTSSTGLLSTPAVVAAPNNMLPPPINDGRRYARLTGQKAGSNRSRRHLVQPLNQTGLSTLPAGVPVEGLGAPLATNSRQSRKLARRGRNSNGLNNGLNNNLNSGLLGVPLATSGLGNTTTLPAPHIAQIPLGAPKITRAQRRANRKNGGLNTGLASVTPIIPTNVIAAPATAPVLISQPMIKQEFIAPISQQSMVGGARF